MKKKLIIVESPTKIKTLKKFLGREFEIASSVGHIRDLPASRFAIDIENNFEPEYDLMEDKKDVIRTIQKMAKAADIVYLAPDPDREGEAIAWHIMHILPPGTKFKRITFNAITKRAVEEAIEAPREIDLNLVNAQQARRLLDRMVGYQISPLLYRRIRRGKDSGLSAGRVQSVALKVIVDRERAIEKFKPVEYWTLSSKLEKKEDPKKLEATLSHVDGLKVLKEAGHSNAFIINSKEIADKVLERLKKATYTVEKKEKKEKKRHPVPPFITSTLQQEASRHYGFSAQRTMQVAQSLYEGIDLGNEGQEGLITYMRTDSVRVSSEAITDVRKYISEKHKDFLPQKALNYSTKKSAQDAHEAIRPTHVHHVPEAVKNKLSIEQWKLYLLIWRRFVASQMSFAIYDTVSLQIKTDNNLTLRAAGSVMKFKGFMVLYEEKNDEESSTSQEIALPNVEEGDVLERLDSTAIQSFTKPPARFTEASLVKELEKSGIGRPSTYVSIMLKIHSRAYTRKEKKAIIPTELGRLICQMLEENFKEIMDLSFTAKMEDDLDLIAESSKDWKQFLGEFWSTFSPLVEIATKEMQVPKQDTEKKCPECGEPLQKIWSRNKYFYGCSKYPDCNYTSSTEDLNIDRSLYREDFDWEQVCKKCGGEMKVRKSAYGLFLGCAAYPKCKSIVPIPLKDEKLPEELPLCPAVGCDGQIQSRKSRFGKTFFSCSNYPECDVIANDVDTLLDKYKDHPKTASVKKAKKKGVKKAATKKSVIKRKTTKKSAVKKKTTKKSAVKKKTTRVQPTFSPSEELKNITGEGEVSRGEATKKIWGYIKERNLQDPNNGRIINPDENLSKILGKEPIDMFKIAGKLSKHLKKD